jgi:hypothetical protein
VLQYGGFRNGYKSKSRNHLLDAYLSYTTDLSAINSRIEVMGGYGYQDFEFTSYNIPGRFFSDNVTRLLPPIFRRRSELATP